MELESVLNELRAKGYKLTPQRIEIVRALMDERYEHPSLNRLLERVREKAPTVSFSTLYTTLKMLEELGYVRLFYLKGETRVEVNLNPHINVVNLRTGDVEDLVDEEAMEALRKALERAGIKGKPTIVNVMVE